MWDDDMLRLWGAALRLPAMFRAETVRATQGESAYVDHLRQLAAGPHPPTATYKR
jgi:hypothetical protein